MERIGVATLLRRASGLTSSRSFVTRKLAEPSQEEMANERGAIHVCILRQDERMGTDGLAQCERQVRRLQARIVKATREGRWGKVKALQRLLTHSFSGKALAVKRVTENQGKQTPGVDGKIWSTPAAKLKAIESLQRRGYKPQPLRRVYIPKANGK